MAQRNAKAKTVANSTVNLDAMMADARNELRTSKDRAMHAAAHCYMIWVETQSPQGKAWFEGKVKHTNEVIEAFNKDLDKDRKEVAEFKAEKLKPEHEALYEGNDPEALKLKADALARINALSKLIDENRAPKKKVKIEQSKTGNEFAMVVKLVFGFTEAADASLASRYASVCNFIHEKSKDNTALDVPTIVALLDTAGGFEVALRHQVKAKQAGKSGVDTEAIKTMTDKAKAENKAAVETMQPLSHFTMPVKTMADGYAVFLARTDGDNVEIVGEAPVTTAQITKMVTSFEPPASSADPAAEFVHRVLCLGKLVGGVAGKATEGKKERKLVMRPDENGKTQVLMSLLGGSANVVVHAAPHDTTNIGAVPAMVALPQDYLHLLTQRLDDPLYRRFTALEPDAAPRTNSGVLAQSVLGWHLQNRALVQANGGPLKETLFWSKVGPNSVNKPVDVEAVKFKTRLIVPRAALVYFWERVLSEAKSNPASNKNTKMAFLKYGDGVLVLDMPAKDNVDYDVVPEVDAAVELEFRPADVIALVETLIGLMQEQFVFEFDEDGLLAVTWADQLGTYSVFQPTVMEGGTLNPKRLAKASPMPSVNLWAKLAANKPAAKVNRAAAQQIVAATPKRTTAKKANVA